jgi:hypothetical protein
VESDRYKAQGLVAQIQKVVNVKDSFTCINLERERERKHRQELHVASIKAKQKEAEDHPGRSVEKRTPALEARILEWTRRAAPDGSTHWSSRKLAQHLGISHMMVARVWQRAGLKPHRIERYMASDDPDFEAKAADIIGLYVKPPQHAAVFCVDEKTAIQALDRLDPVLPLSPGRLERHGF